MKYFEIFLAILSQVIMNICKYLMDVLKNLGKGDIGHMNIYWSNYKALELVKGPLSEAKNMTKCSNLKSKQIWCKFCVRHV
jgi:hypothetical protein